MVDNNHKSKAHMLIHTLKEVSYYYKPQTPTFLETNK